MPRLVTSKTYPSLPLAVNDWPLSKTSKGKQYSVWGMTLSFCCLSHAVFNSEIGFNQILKCKLFYSIQLIIIILILFSKLYASSELNFWSLSNQKSKKEFDSVRQAASKTKLLREKRERKYFIVSLTIFSCVIQHSVAKQMLWSKNYQLLLYPDGTVW